MHFQQHETSVVREAMGRDFRRRERNTAERFYRIGVELGRTDQQSVELQGDEQDSYLSDLHDG